MTIRRSPHISIWLFAIMLLTGAAARVLGQEQSQYDKGTPPQHAAGVSPLGSYNSTELGSINLGNGALNFRIPLTTVGGRGFSIPLTLNYSSKVWSASKDTDVTNSGQPFEAAYADYANLDNFVDFFERVGPGWTIGAAPIIFNRIVRINKLPSGGPNGGCYTYTVPKLTVMLPDKGEIEFRDDLYDGAPLPSDCGGWVSTSRGKRWHATDGSGAVYISTVDNGAAERFGNFSGVMITADGTRYVFTGSRCTSITDRNGNRIDITYTSSPSKVEYKDQLGRITKIEQFVADPDNPSVTLAVLVTLPGYSGNQYIKIKREVMSSNYRSDITPPSTVCTGIYDPHSKGYSTWCGSSPTILFPHSYGLYLQRIDNQQVLTEVVLPDDRSLRFKYNLYGEVAEAQLPTGGKLWYDYEHQSNVPVGNSQLWEIGADFHTEVGEIDRAVVQRRVFDGSTLQATWGYSYTTTDVIVVATSPTDGVRLNQRHRFLPSLRYTDYNGNGAHDGTQYSLWSTGVEWKTETRNAAGTVVLAAVEKDWTQRAPVSWSGYPQEQPANDNRVNEQRNYLETGLMAKTQMVYDQYNNPTEVKEYDYDQTLKRRTVTSYLNNNIGFNYQTDDTIHLLGLPVSQTIYDGNNNQKAATVTEYDNYTNDGNRDLLTSYLSVSQHDPNYSSTKKTRGNPTRIGSWLNTTGNYVYVYPRYDIVGNVISTKDARGNVSTVSFADDFGAGVNPGTPTQNPATPTYALPTLLTSPPPVAGTPVHTARCQYDYSTGLLTGFRDRNNVITQTIYDDPFNRPTLVKSALGISGEESHVKTFYAPATVYGITLSRNDALTASDQTTLGDGELRNWTITDGFGRTTETWKRDPLGNVKVATTYDALGRPVQVSNPFRPTTESANYTISTYDLLGRVVSVKTPDNALVSTSYSANTVTVTDQAGKVRKSVTDGLGRLIEVYEDPGGLNYQTTYIYDTLDNLVKVTQGTQQRFFMYDSLKRLIRARNPEQGTLSALNLSDPFTGNGAWSTGYEYDVSNNLTQKTDARGVVSTYVYDALNRNTTVDYSDTSLNPDVKRFYDGATNGKGRFWYQYTGDGVTAGSDSERSSIESYDAAGRPLVQQQLFKVNGTAYQTSRSYNRAGGVTSQTYPSGHSIGYNYDVAGRLADALTPAFTGNLGDGVLRTYASELNYNSWGSLGMERFGTQTALYHKLQYNVRGQLWDVRVSTGSDVNGSWNRGALQFFYEGTYGFGSSGPDNNGNVLRSKHYVPLDESSSPAWAIHDQVYTYDSLNRLTSVAESFLSDTQPLATQHLLQTYSYDRWGNRTIKADDTWIGNSSAPPSLLLNETQFDTSLLASTNRLQAPGDDALAENQKRMRYDSAGNLIKDTYTGAGERVYDAENHMTKAWGGNNQWQYYTYNADGKRTRRKIDNQETWHVYGFEGELLAEYAAEGPTNTPSKEYGYRNGELLIVATPSTGGDHSLSVNGTSAYAQVPNSTSLNITGAITVEAWIKPNAIGTYQYIASRESYGVAGTGGGYELTLNNLGKIRFDLYHTPTTYTPVIGSTTLTTGQWYHVAGVFDGSQMRIYVNGVLDASVANSNGPASGTSTLKFGRNSGGNYFNGLIDEVRVSNAAIYMSNFPTQQHLTASGSTKGLWKFDGQTPNDSSSNGNNGTLQGSAGYSTDVATGPAYHSLSVNGSSAYAQVPNSTSLNITGAITVEAWIKPNAIGTYQYIASRESYGVAGTGGGYELTLNNLGKIRFDVYHTPTTYTPVIGNTALTTGQWYHVAGVFDGSQMRIYVNGVLDASVANGNGPASGTSTLKFGRNSGGNYFNGLIDEVRVSNAAIYTSNFPTQQHLTASGSTKGLWKFDGQTPNDSSSNGNNGTLQGSAGYSSDVPSGDGGGGSSSGTASQIQWLVADHLGTPRIVLDQSGALTSVKRHDYLPFGEELISVGLRSTSLGYVSDGVRQQFTAKERDNETGLDYFIARYHSPIQGRFTSADELASLTNPLLHADTRNPQTLNKYQYVNNSPLNATDPDGHCPDNQPCPPISVQSPSGNVNENVGYIAADVAISAGKTVANIGIGINNFSNFFLNGDKAIEPYESSSKTQKVAMHAFEVLTVVAPLLSGFGPATTMTASSRQTTVVAAEAGNVERVSTLKPGPFASESIPARGSARNWNATEQSFARSPGRCHICGTTDPGTKSDAFVLDHQPVSALNFTNAPQRLFKSCLACSQRQGGEVRAALSREKTFTERFTGRESKFKFK